MNNNQISTKPNKNKIIIITAFGALAVIIIAVLIIILVQNNQQGSGDKETTAAFDDNVPLDAVGPTEAKFRKIDGYSAMLNLYYSIDNDMLLDTVKTIVADGGLNDSTILNGKTGCYTISDSTQSESVKYCVTDDDGTDYIDNLEFDYKRGDRKGFIKEIQDSMFQHFDGKITSDHETKVDAIEDYLIKQ
ncbi:MAG: hypothetical protein K6F57_01215 [Candidatus Saccharibacteria bacterium]|nr:hypothetical protein [Candidatus Saccharibacteria bacterium]